MDPVSTSGAKSDQGEQRAPGLFALLRTRRFLPLFLAQSLGAFNAGVLAVQVANANVPDRFALGVFILTLLLFADTAGQVADKFEKTRLLRIVKAFEIPVAGLTCLGLALQSAVLLLCAFGIFALLITLFTPVRHAVLAHRLAADELVGGNVLLAAGTAMALVVGALAGMSLGGMAIWIAVVCVAVAVAGYAASREIPAAPAADPDLAIGFNPLAGITRSYRALRGERTSLFALFGVAWFWVSGALLLIQLWRLPSPVSGAATLGALLAVVALGGVVTGLFLSEKLSAGFSEFGLVPVGFAGQAVLALDLVFLSPALAVIGGAAATTALPGTASYWRVLFDLFAFCVFGGLLLPPLYVQLQTRTDHSRRGRILSLGIFIFAVALPIAGAAALSATGSGAVFVGLAACALIVAAWAYRCETHLTLRFLTWLLIHAFYRVGKSGFGHIPGSGPAVLVCNHVSFVDSVVIMAAVRRPIRFVMDHRIHQTPVVGFLFKHSRTIPIATAKEDPAMKEAAFEEVARALRNGELVGLFPEGRITHTGEINHFRYGVGRIVAETPVPVVPMALRGLWGSFFSRRHGPAMSKPSLLRWLAKVELVVGGPVAPEMGTPEYLQEVVTTLRGGMV